MKFKKLLLICFIAWLILAILSARNASDNALLGATYFMFARYVSWMFSIILLLEISVRSNERNALTLRSVTQWIFCCVLYFGVIYSDIHKLIFIKMNSWAGVSTAYLIDHGLLTSGYIVKIIAIIVSNAFQWLFIIIIPLLLPILCSFAINALFQTIGVKSNSVGRSDNPDVSQPDPANHSQTVK
jgi:glucan phosphoethanolaminetransferase (alkaline phosphatase superfamily)